MRAKNLQEEKQYISLGCWGDLLSLVKSLFRNKFEECSMWFKLASKIIKVVVRTIIQSRNDKWQKYSDFKTRMKWIVGTGKPPYSDPGHVTNIAEDVDAHWTALWSSSTKQCLLFKTSVDYMISRKMSHLRIVNCGRS